jgi:hypothetical protein
LKYGSKERDTERLETAQVKFLWLSEIL